MLRKFARISDMCKSISYTMGAPKGGKGGLGAEPFEKTLSLSNLSIKIIQIVYFNHSVTKLEINNRKEVENLQYLV